MAEEFIKIDEKALTDDIQLLCNRVAMKIAKRAKDELVETMKIGLQDYYDSYTPTGKYKYRRSGEFMKHAFKPIYKNQHGNKFVGGISLSPWYINVPHARSIDKRAYGGEGKEVDGIKTDTSLLVEDVYEWNMEGWHGSKIQTTSIWDMVNDKFQREMKNNFQNWCNTAKEEAIHMGGYSLIY